MFQCLGGRRARRHDLHPEPALAQPAEDVVFQPEIIGDNRDVRRSKGIANVARVAGRVAANEFEIGALPVVGIPKERLAMRHLFDVIDPHQPFPRLRSGHRFSLGQFPGRNDPFQRPANAKPFGQGPRVHALDARHAVFLQIFRQGKIRPPVAHNGRQFANDKARHVRLPRFHVLPVHSVIANQRISHRDDLAFVGRVGENFLVARHGGVETNFTAGRRLGAETCAVKNGTVFEG